MLTLRITLICLLLLCSMTGTDRAFAEDPGYVISAQFENDFFGGGTDRHFTHGTRIECLTRPIKWITDAANNLPWFKYEENKSDSKGSVKARASISMGQNMYTPEDTYTTRLVQDDRPYAGWSYIGFGLVANQGSERYDKLLLELGVVGPASYAGDVQERWHKLLGLHVPEGWDHQLHNEPGAVLYYEQAGRIQKRLKLPGLEVDVVPHFGGAIGNVFSYAAGGFTFRLGSGLEEDFGPPRIRPSLPGGGWFYADKGFDWYLFAGLEGRAVVHNVFLDGNTFRDSHSVDKRPLVGDLQAGIALQWSRLRISYTQIFRTKEFDGQYKEDVFGSVNLSFHF